MVLSENSNLGSFDQTPKEWKDVKKELEGLNLDEKERLVKQLMTRNSQRDLP